jgi:hypothetical protein
MGIGHRKNIERIVGATPHVALLKNKQNNFIEIMYS